MISLPSDTRISLVAGVTDMRKSFNGLGEQVQHVLDENPFSGHLFIFRGRRSDMIKILWADADGRKRKLTAVCSHQTRIGNLDAHLI